VSTNPQRAPGLLGLAILASAISGCWRTGDPTPSAAIITWTGYPDTVRVGAPFSLEFAGPISPTACGRLDTETLAVSGREILIEARRSTFAAVCAKQRISFYEARPLTLTVAGEYAVRTVDGRDFGAIVATDSGPFSSVRTRGEGTVREIAGCWLFGPGWIGDQRLFALARLPAEVREVAGSDRIIHVRGTLRGFASCGNWGSRPRIRVDTAWVTDRRTSGWYDGSAPDSVRASRQRIR